VTKTEALAIVGNRATWELKAMRRALSIHSWLNTAEENKRLQACKILLRGKA
jgi:hypothetical protein